jgi:hypothetical protein
MENEILDLIDRYWKFDDNQQPVSTWHDKQDLLEAVRKALRIHDVSGRSELCCSPTDGFYLGTTCPHCNKPFRKDIK